MRAHLALLALASLCDLAASAGQPSFHKGLPSRPLLRTSGYPGCKNDWRKLSDRTDKYLSVKDCIVQIEAFNADELKSFPLRVRRYDRQLNLYYARFNTPSNGVAARRALRDYVEAEQACFRSADRINSYGDCYADYYRLLRMYRADIDRLINLREMFRRVI